MTDTTRDLIQQLAGLARRKHYTCEDSWYSCPQSESGSANDNAGAECNCGADEHNAKVDAICAALSLSEPEGLTDEEIMDLMPQLMHEDLASAARAMAAQAGTDNRNVAGMMRIILNHHAVDLARAVLARWGRATVEPPIKPAHNTAQHSGQRP